MLTTYKQLEAKGKIGPMDEQGRLRSYQEYPKRIDWIDKDGHKSDRIVNSLREELALRAEMPGDKPDPVVEEKNRLAEELAAAKAEIARIQAALDDQKKAEPTKVESKEKVHKALDTPPEPVKSPRAPVSGDGPTSK